jgi:hypothetical protein
LRRPNYPKTWRPRARRLRALAVDVVEEVAAVVVPEAKNPFPPRRHRKRFLSPRETNRQKPMVATRSVARAHAGAAAVAGGVGRKLPRPPTTRRTSL